MRRQGWYRVGRRSRSSLLISVAVHAASIAFLVNIAFQYDLGSLRSERGTWSPPEKLQFVRVSPRPGGGLPDARQLPGAGPAATARLRAPTAVPTTLPQPAPMTPAVTGNEDRAGRPGAGDPTIATGVQPAYSDPRLWPQPGPFIPLSKTAVQRTDSAVQAAFRLFADSAAIAAANRGRSPTDWTFERNGEKWGLDDRWLHLGKVKIPNALLALLPLNAQANPTFNDPVTRRESAFRLADIQYHANRAIGEEEFRKAVRRIRERKERERAAAKAEKANGDGQVPVATQMQERR